MVSFDCSENLFRYGFLLLENAATKDPLSVSVAILHQFNILPEMYQVGYTKLFFRTGQVNFIFWVFFSCKVYCQHKTFLTTQTLIFRDNSCSQPQHRWSKTLTMMMMINNCECVSIIIIIII